MTGRASPASELPVVGRQHAVQQVVADVVVLPVDRVVAGVGARVAPVTAEVVFLVGGATRPSARTAREATATGDLGGERLCLGDREPIRGPPRSASAGTRPISSSAAAAAPAAPPRRGPGWRAAEAVDRRAGRRPRVSAQPARDRLEERPRPSRRRTSARPRSAPPAIPTWIAAWYELRPRAELLRAPRNAASTGRSARGPPRPVELDRALTRSPAAPSRSSRLSNVTPGASRCTNASTSRSSWSSAVTGEPVRGERARRVVLAAAEPPLRSSRTQSVVRRAWAWLEPRSASALRSACRPRRRRTTAPVERRSPARREHVHHQVVALRRLRDRRVNRGDRPDHLGQRLRSTDRLPHPGEGTVIASQTAGIERGELPYRQPSGAVALNRVGSDLLGEPLGDRDRIVVGAQARAPQALDGRAAAALALATIAIDRDAHRAPLRCSDRGVALGLIDIAVGTSHVTDCGARRSPAPTVSAWTLDNLVPFDFIPG